MSVDQRTNAETPAHISRGDRLDLLGTSAVADRDGLHNVSFGYQWLADDSNIAGATDSSLHPYGCQTPTLAGPSG